MTILELYMAEMLMCIKGIALIAYAVLTVVSGVRYLNGHSVSRKVVIAIIIIAILFIIVPSDDIVLYMVESNV